MFHRTLIGMLAVTSCFMQIGLAYAQDVPGIEICTAEKTMERRTSCLQSNVDFLMKSIGKVQSENAIKLDAANRQIEALKASVVALQKSVDDLKAAKTPADQKLPSKDAPAKDAPAKDVPAKEGAK